MSITALTTPYERRLIYICRLATRDHEGLLKIGDHTVGNLTDGLTPAEAQESYPPNCEALKQCALKRIRDWANTAGLSPTLLHAELAIDNQGHTFRDHALHRVLVNSGIQRFNFAPDCGAQEWFRTNLDTALNALAALKAGRNVLGTHEVVSEQEALWQMRPNQAEAVEMTCRRFAKQSSKQPVLWNAKMRFGKTIAAFFLIKQKQFQRTLLITHRPAVKRGWQGDMRHVFGSNSPMTFCTKETGLPADPKARFIYFASLQDMRGSEAVGGNFSKNEALFQTQWDLLIIDEAHEGTQTELGHEVIDHLRRRHTLYLSGTPFNISDQFSPENIYTWDYVDEQRAKREWALLHGLDDNPYEELPQLMMFVYALSDHFKGYETETLEGKCFNFKEFFRTWRGDPVLDEGRMPATAQVGDFVHVQDVRRFVALLRDEQEETNFPFSNQAFRQALRHTFWKLPGVSAAKALQRLLQEDPVFQHFKVVNVAGAGDEEVGGEEALALVQEAIRANEYTITLSCGRLTTGVTVPEWTGVLLLAGGEKVSAAAYLQTLFRVQSPYTHPQAGMKQRCYAFDFAPDRTLTLASTMAKTCNKCTPSGPGGGQGGDERSAVTDLLNFLPILAMNGGREVPYAVDDIFRVIRRASIERAIFSGFEDSCLYNPEMLRADNLNAQELNALGRLVGQTIRGAKLPEVLLAKTNLTEEERDKKKEKARTAHPLTPEEKAELEQRKAEKTAREAAINILRTVSIRMPLLLFGVEIDAQEGLSIEDFVERVDEASWAEFMPKGLTKDAFRPYLKYYDAETFRLAGLQIHRLAQAADNEAPTERVIAIARIFSYFRNPAKETVLTPWRVVNEHLAQTLGGYAFYDETFQTPLDLPRRVDRPECDLFSAPGPKRLLEINSKSGLYPLYAAYSLFRSRLEAARQAGEDLTSHDAQQRLWRQVVAENLFVLCQTPMALAITRRTLLGHARDSAGKPFPANLYHIPSLVTSLRENIGATARIAEHLNFPGTWSLPGVSPMHFNAIFGNPPYQANIGGAAPLPIYHAFVNLALACKPNFISMIMPSRWLTTGSGLGAFRKERFADDRLRLFYHFPDAHALFPTVDIKGGINYFLWCLGYHGKADFFTFNQPDRPPIHARRYLADETLGAFVQDERVLPILQKIRAHKEPTLDTWISSQDPFGYDIRLPGSLRRAPHRYQQEADGEHPVAFYYNGWRKVGHPGYVSRASVSQNCQWIDAWKVLIPKAWGRGGIEFGKLNTAFIVPGPSVCTETYLVAGVMSSEAEAQNLHAYLQTAFFYFLVGQRKISQNAAKGVYSLVPIQDFSRAWTDEELYAKYGLTPEEINFIEEMVRPMARPDKDAPPAVADTSENT